MSRFAPTQAALADVQRVFEIWDECLGRSGGPFLFGRFSVADAMYFPVLSRFRTYGVALPDGLQPYALAIESAPPVRALLATARKAPRIPIYDEYVRSLGGDPDAALGAAETAA